MATTPTLALPYPVGTDLVVDGDDAIQALAEKIESNTIAAPSAPATPHGSAVPSAYPVGMSVCTVFGARGWPMRQPNFLGSTLTVIGMVQTLRLGTTATQTLFEKDQAVTWTRHSAGGTDTWLPWLPHGVYDMTPLGVYTPSATPDEWPYGESIYHTSDPLWPAITGAVISALVRTFVTPAASGSGWYRVEQRCIGTPATAGAATTVHQRSGVFDPSDLDPQMWGAWQQL